MKKYNKMKYQDLMSRIGAVVDKLVKMKFKPQKSLACWANYNLKNITDRGIAIMFKDDGIFIIESSVFFFRVTKSIF